MANVTINDSGLLSEIKNTRETNEAVKTLKLDLDKKDLKMQSIDKYAECMAALNETILSFYEMCEEDIHNLEIIRGEWLGLDEIIATKTISEYVDNFNKKIYGH